MTAENFAAAETALMKLDPILGKLIDVQRPLVREPRSNYFESLCRSVVGQQVSVAAASTIFGRLVNTTHLEHQAVHDLSDKQIKTIGLSRQKAAYLKDIAAHYIENPRVYDHLDSLDDDTVIAELTAIKGIGVWSAQMFLMFTLLRPDVFAPADVGLQRAMKILYGWDSVPDAKTLTAQAEAWRPYRTMASWHLWESLNNTPGAGV